MDGCESLASEVVVSAFRGNGHVVLRPGIDSTAVEAQTLALEADLIVLDAVPTAEATPRDIGEMIPHQTIINVDTLIIVVFFLCACLFYQLISLESSLRCGTHLLAAQKESCCSPQFSLGQNSLLWARTEKEREAQCQNST